MYASATHILLCLRTACLSLNNTKRNTNRIASIVFVLKTYIHQIRVSGFKREQPCAAYFFPGRVGFGAGPRLCRGGLQGRFAGEVCRGGLQGRFA